MASAPLARFEQYHAQRAPGRTVGLEHGGEPALRGVEHERLECSARLVLYAGACGAPVLEVVAAPQLLPLGGVGSRSLVCRVGKHRGRHALSARGAWRCNLLARPYAARSGHGVVRRAGEVAPYAVEAEYKVCLTHYDMYNLKPVNMKSAPALPAILAAMLRAGAPAVRATTGLSMSPLILSRT